MNYIGTFTAQKLRIYFVFELQWHKNIELAKMQWHIFAQNRTISEHWYFCSTKLIIFLGHGLHWH
jgi:hypothetical protein